MMHFQRIVSICITIIGWFWNVLGQAQVSTSLSSLFHFHFLPKHCHHHCCRPRHPYRRDHVIIGIAIKFIFPTTVTSSSNYSCSCAVSGTTLVKSCWLSCPLWPQVAKHAS